MTIATTSSYTEPKQDLIFCPIASKSPLFSKVQEVFAKKIAPLYGDQTSALRKLEEGKDRRCEVLTENDKPVGLIVYKTAPQNEYKLTNSLEIKTLIVIDPETNSNRGLGSKLIDRIIRVAKQQLASGIHVTVSDKVAESRFFFEKRGFSVVHTWEGRYIPGVREYLLYRPLQSQAEATPKR